MTSWELVSQLFWMPFDIMTRITRQFFHLGRNIYGSLFGSRPAIKPPPSPSPSTSSSPLPSTHLQHFPPPEITSHNSTLLALSSPPTVFNPVPSCVIDITGTTSSLEACAASSMNHLEILSENMITSSSERQQAGNDSESAAADKNLHANLAHAESGEPTTTIEGKKRLEDNAKRGTVTSKHKKSKIAKDDDDDGETEKTAQFEANSSNVVPTQSKKPKLSEEEPSSSVSSAVARSNSNSSKNKKKRAKKKTNQGEETGEQEGGKMGRSSPPNFFIAVQISNKDIISKVGNLQKSLSEKTLVSSWHGLTTTEVFKDAMVPATKLHFTLHVMHLDGQQQIEKAQSAFKECCSEIGQGFIDNPLDLTIEGLGHFKSSVLFAQIKDEDQVSRLTQLSDHFRRKFNEIDIQGDPRPFKPHLTIAKTSRSNKLYKMRVRSFPPDIWSGLEDTNFGTQRVNGVQLLFMSGEDKSTGYYKCLAQHDFHDSLVNNPTTTVPSTTVNRSTSGQGDEPSQENKVLEPNKHAA